MIAFAARHFERFHAWAADVLVIFAEAFLAAFTARTEGNLA